MGDHFNASYPKRSFKAKIVSRKKLSKSNLVVSASKILSQKTLRCVTSIKQSIQGGRAGEVAIFLVSVVALEIVRRFSRANCPFIWRGLQGLQILSYPPFRWIEKWAPFKWLVKPIQRLSRPMLALTIATVFSDQADCSIDTSDNVDDSQAYSDSQPEQPVNLGGPTSYRNEGCITGTSEEWLIELRRELERQGIAIPERLGDDELRRFYAVANGDFLKFLSLVKRTISWRQSYTIFPPEELEAWSHLVFWHGHDLKLRPCLIIRLGLACADLKSHNRHVFVKAIVSQIEHGITSKIDSKHSQITVLMDCEGLSPFGFPIHTMRSCAVLLQDHYPNRLGCLIIVRLPQVARLVTQTLFQVLRPATRQKVRVVGGNYQEFLSKLLQPLPPFLGGDCSCSKCSDCGEAPGKITGAVREKPSLDPSNAGSPNRGGGDGISGKGKHLGKAVIVGMLTMSIIFFILVFRLLDSEGLSFLSSMQH